VLNDENCLLNVIRDITEMKEAEARLARSEARFRSLISVMGEGLIILGYNGEIVQCNQAAERIMKIKADDIIGKLHHELMHEVIHEDGRVYAAEEHPSALTLQTGKPVVNQIMGFPMVDGRTAWLQVNTSALGLDRSGKPVAVVVSFADVTRLKRIETDLRESEQHMKTLSRQFQGVLEAIPDRIMILDTEMRVIWLNWFEDDSNPTEQKLFENLCCYELPGVHCGPSSGADSPLCDNCPVQKSLVTGRTEEAQIESSDGRTLSLRAFPVFNELGEVVNVIEIAQDITESLRHQAQSMRTGQLAALGELAAGVAHEINNPINGVINYAQLILNKAVADSREQELSQRIIRESERVATIVRELLYFAREESQEVKKTTVSAALSEALALTQNQLNKEGIQLQIQLPENLPSIMSRSHQIQQLFLNLISNARHALAEKYAGMDPDKILLVKGEEILKNDQPFVRITFRDHGVGIDAKLLPRVMNPFTTTKSSSEGTGLGLSISHEIVQKHGGTLTIDSVHGEFTEVVVELPAEK
jgi:PAS domain S-box-containing protein